MSGPEQRLCDALGLDALIIRLAGQILDGRTAGVPLALVGVRSRGVPLAERIAIQLRRETGDAVPVGALDITLYRDDMERARRWPVLQGTDIPFAVDGVEVILVDDVLHTGRTVRAALNAICDLGRPACIRLAIAVDRGGRELPIQPDAVGLVVVAAPGARVHVRIAPVDAVEEVVRISAPKAGEVRA
ncbi:bifunctional pyr operon transcriptional regulator/uracil phosphoribosyltransferase PyrR [Isosphaeraceae bacterium EP7]